MGKAVSSYNYDIDSIIQYFIPMLEMEDRKDLFKYNIELWTDFTILLFEAFKAFSEEEKGAFDFKMMFDTLNGKIPYKGRRKKIEIEGGKIIFILLNESLVDYMFNQKIDSERKKIILKTAKKFKNLSIKKLQKI